MLKKWNALLFGVEILMVIVGLFSVLDGNYSLAAVNYGLATYLHLVRVDTE